MQKLHPGRELYRELLEGKACGAVGCAAGSNWEFQKWITGQQEVRRFRLVFA